jgi:hypothetical protein
MRLLASAGSVVAFGSAMWLMNPVDSGSADKVSEYTPRNRAQARSSEGNKQVMEMLRRNVNTGKIERQDFLNARAAVEQLMQNRVTTLTWVDRGPDNIGGRTRAILIDRNDANHVFAGSVSGGLFESLDGGNNWTKVNSFTENLSISSIAQSVNGKLFVATGHAEEGTSGNGDSGGWGLGIYMSDDNGASWTLIPGTESYTYVNEIVTDTRMAERIWIACSASPGLRVYENGTLQTAASWGATGLPASGGFTALDISPDGTVLVGCGQSNQTYVSADGGLTWAEKSGSGAGEVPNAGIGRVEYAISRTKNNLNFYNIYASLATSGGAFGGAYMSDDNGTTWYQIAPNTSSQNPNNTGTFTPFSTSLSNQGNYNNIISVHPTNPGRVFLGGIDVYEWNQGTTSPPFGQWEQVSLWFASPESPVYVHADNHEMKWDQNGWLYIGNDGGIAKSPPGSVNGVLFFPANRGYNVAQFYSVAFSKEGWVMGGTQDNGSLLNDGSGTTALEFDEVRGGDGFDCDISFINSDVMFASVYTGDMQRSDDRGNTWSTFFSNALGAIASQAGFYTTGRLYENPDDVNSGDSVAYVPFTNLGPGDTLPNLFSLTGQIPITYVLGAGETLCYADTLMMDGTVIIGGNPVNYALHPCSPGDTIYMDDDTALFEVGLDTLMIQDKIQSWYAFGVGGSNGVWVTRQALRFNVTPDWYQVAGGANAADGSGMGSIKSLEFSADGNHLYIGTWSGELWRVSGLASIYASDGNAVGKATVASPTRTVTTTKIYDGNAASAITGIGIDPQDPGHVVFTVGGFGVSTHIYESFTADVDAATTGVGSFTSIQGNLPDMPAYDVVIDRSNNNQIIVGTEMGVYVTDNANGGATTWNYASGDFGNVPVFAVRQQWRSWDEGALRPGEIYIGTHGRGIWASATLLSTPDNNPHSLFGSTFAAGVLIYPNPVEDMATARFELSAAADVQVRIIGLDGRVAATIAAGNLGKGVQEVQFNAADLSAGTYILEVTGNGQRSLSKFVVKR